MLNLAQRNLRLFFRDKSSVFFSFLGVIVIISLYLLFLGDLMVQGIDLPGVRYMMDSWIMAGLLSVVAVTSTMGAFGIMVEDVSNKIYKDFYVSPLRRYRLAGGYLIGAFVTAVIMSLVTLVFAEIYILIGGGSLMPLETLIKVFGLILLGSLCSCAFIFFIVSFFKTSNAFAAASTVLGTIIGFLTGIYIPIGSLPEGVRLAIKLFPVSHLSALFRQVMMRGPMETSFAGAPAEFAEEFKEVMGVVYKFEDYTVTPGVHIAVLLGTAALFYGLAVLRLSLKKK